MEITGPNAEQIRYWNDLYGPRWVALQRALDAQLEPLGLAALDRLALSKGQRVIDVGCGAGATTLEIAERVGPSGEALGVDLSAPLLERAVERAREARLAQARFVNADAQTHAFEPARYDALYSRFGVMFFADPQGAFANMRVALVPGARVAFVCWRAMENNPWMTVPLAAARALLPPSEPPVPGAPGPFAFAEGARVRALLEGAGFANVAVEPFDTRIALGGGVSLDEAAALTTQIGPLGAALRESPERADAVCAAVRAALEPYAGPGGIWLDAAAWIVTARNPG